jgi:hypothetical protein
VKKIKKRWPRSLPRSPHKCSRVLGGTVTFAYAGFAKCTQPRVHVLLPGATRLDYQPIWPIRFKMIAL